MNNYTHVISVDCNWLGRHALLLGVQHHGSDRHRISCLS